MKHPRRAGTWLGLLTVMTAAAWSLAAPQAADRAHAFDDGAGKEWRQLYETTSLSWDAVATVCPQDGATPCAGAVGGRDLTGWVWATEFQVRELMAPYAPWLLTGEPEGFGFGAAAGFMGVMRWTGYVATTYSYAEWTYGWTASKDANGLPIGGGASYGYWPPAGGIGVGPVPNSAEVNSYRGVFLWREAGADWTPPSSPTR